MLYNNSLTLSFKLKGFSSLKNNRNQLPPLKSLSVPIAHSTKINRSAVDQFLSSTHPITVKNLPMPGSISL